MKRLTKKQMWIFAVGQLGWSILGGIISAWLVAFYLPTKDKDGLHFSGSDIDFYTIITPGLIIGGFLTIIGLITALCRIWDAVSDPLIANLSDNSKNKKGRRMPFMKFAAIPFAIITVLIFMAPSLFREEGREEGMQQGEAHARRLLARNMLAEGMSPATIARISGLSEAEVMALANE